MGVVLEFPSERDTKRAATAVAGEVVIFPGVRRERLGAICLEAETGLPSPRLPQPSPRKRGS